MPTSSMLDTVTRCLEASKALSHIDGDNLKDIEEGISFVADLSRSVELMQGYDRTHDDYRNAQVRFVILESLVSRLMNQAIEGLSDDKPRVAIVLDSANAAIWENDDTVEDKLEPELEFFDDSERFVYYTNLAYEALQRVNSDIGYKTDYKEPPSHIVKTVEFRETERLAGMTMLTALSKILSEEFEEANLNVSIRESKGRVVFAVEFPSNIRHLVEEKISKFGAAVRSSGDLSAVVNDPMLKIQMEQQLEFSNMQLRHERDRNEFFKGRIETLEKMVLQLSESLKPLAETAQSSAMTLSSIAEKSMDNFLLFIRTQREGEESVQVREALKKIEDFLANGNLNKAELEVAVADIAKHRPSLLRNISGKVRDGMISGASQEGFQALLDIISNLPI